MRSFLYRKIKSILKTISLISLLSFCIQMNACTQFYGDYFFVIVLKYVSILFHFGFGSAWSVSSSGATNFFLFPCRVRAELRVDFKQNFQWPASGIYYQTLIYFKTRKKNNFACFVNVIFCIYFFSFSLLATGRVVAFYMKEIEMTWWGDQSKQLANFHERSWKWSSVARKNY